MPLSGTFYTAVNDGLGGTNAKQRFQINLDITSSTAPVVQWVQSVNSGSASGYTSEAVGQRFVFGAWITNPLELKSTQTGTSISSFIQANTFNAYSDIRLKKDVKLLDETQGVDNIRVVRYNNKSDNSSHFGVIAHELAEIYPELVSGEASDEKTMQSVSYVELIPICINEIQRLKKDTELLQARLKKLEHSLL